MALVGTAEVKGLEYLKHLFDEQQDGKENERNLSNNMKKKAIEVSSPSSARLHDWSELPRDINNLIADKLRFFPHLQKFGAACGEWRDITNEIIKPVTHKIKSEPPMLLLPYNQETQIATFLELKDSKRYNVKMPELKDQWICGASNGWLAMTDDNLNLFLFSPLTRAHIKLPPDHDPRAIALFRKEYPRTCIYPHWYRCRFIHKVVLSGDPSSSDCMVAIIYHDWYWLGLCRLRDEYWSVTNSKGTHMKCRSYDDVTFFKRRIFAASSNERVHVFDYSGESGLSSPILITQMAGFSGIGRQLTKHLVESCGELLLVLRYCKMNKYEKTLRPHKTCGFEVFKLKEDMESWDKVNSLGDRVLFLGPNDSISLSTKEFPWYKPNCIYFTQEFMDTNGEHGFQWDNGVYSLKEDRVIEKFDIQHSLSFWPAPAMWFRAKSLKI